MHFTANCIFNDSKSVEEALLSSDKDMWMKTMEEEHESLGKNTWTVVDLPQGQRILDTKWIFKRKQDFSDKIQR